MQTFEEVQASQNTRADIYVDKYRLPEHRSAKKTRRISTHPYKSKETSPIRIMNYSPTTAHNIAIQNQRKTPKDLEADLKNKYDAVIDMKNLEK